MMAGSVRSSVAVVLFCYVFGYSVINPLFPQLLIKIFEGDDSKASNLNGLLGSISSLLNFLILPSIIALSDSVGSKTILLCSLGFGTFLYFLLIVLIENVFIVGFVYVLNGMTIVNIPVCNVIIGKTSSDSESSSHNFGLVTAIFGLSLVFGPLLGTILSTINPRYTCFIAALTSAIAFLFVLLSSWIDITNCGKSDEENKRDLLLNIQPWKILKIFFSSKKIFWLAVAYLFFDTSAAAFNNMFILLHYRYEWSPVLVGIYLSLFGVATLFVQTFMLRTLVPSRISEARAIFFAASVQWSGWLLQAFCTKGWMFYASISVVSTQVLFEPCMLGQLSQLVPQNKQGSLQGAITSLRTLTQIFSDPMYGSIFSVCTSEKFENTFGFKLPFSPYLLASLYSLLCLLTLLECTQTYLSRRVQTFCGVVLESVMDDSMKEPLVITSSSEMYSNIEENMGAQESAPDN